MAAVVIVRGGIALSRVFVRLASALGGKIKREVKQKVKEKFAGPFEPEVISFADIQKGKVAERAVLAAAQVVKNDAISLVPKGTGLLASSIGIQLVPVGKGLGIQIKGAGASATVFTGSRADLQIDANASGYYPAALEFGYRHARSGNFVPARPYLRPALYNNQSRVLNIMKRELRLGIFKVSKTGMKVLDVSRSTISTAIPQTAINRLATRLVTQ